MIKFLSIENLQKHVKSEVSFSDGVNYIVGETDYGKSAIIRAIRWVLHNKPSNTSMMRRGSKKPTTSELLINGKTVKRIRGKAKNSYIFEGVVKKGFGKDVPQQIADLVGCDESLMIQRQGDPYFLLGLSSGAERARALEKYLELSAISESMTRARKCLFSERKRKDEIKAVRTELKAEKSRVKKALPFIQAVEELRGQGDEYLSLHTDLTLLKENDSILQSLRSKKSKLERLIAVDASECLADVQKRSDLADSVADMKRLLGLRRNASKLEVVVTLLNEVEVLSKQYEREYIAFRDIAVQNFYRLETQTQMNRIRMELKTTDEQLAKIKVCPTCGSKLK